MQMRCTSRIVPRIFGRELDTPSSARTAAIVIRQSGGNCLGGVTVKLAGLGDIFVLLERQLNCSLSARHREVHAKSARANRPQGPRIQVVGGLAGLTSSFNSKDCNHTRRGASPPTLHSARTSTVMQPARGVAFAGGALFVALKNRFERSPYRALTTSRRFGCGVRRLWPERDSSIFWRVKAASRVEVETGDTGQKIYGSQC